MGETTFYSFSLRFCDCQFLTKDGPQERLPQTVLCLFCSLFKKYEKLILMRSHVLRGGFSTGSEMLAAPVAV